MIITNDKIEVTWEMMTRANMTRGTQFGVPVDPSNPSKGLEWIAMFSMKDEHYERIEEYFFQKQEAEASK